MTDIKEVQGLEVVAYVIEKKQRRDTFRQLSFKKPAPTTDSKDQWQVTATLTDLGKAQAVIDTLRKQVDEARELLKDIRNKGHLGFDLAASVYNWLEANK